MQIVIDTDGKDGQCLLKFKGKTLELNTFLEGSTMSMDSLDDFVDNFGFQFNCENEDAELDKLFSIMEDLPLMDIMEFAKDYE